MESNQWFKMTPQERVQEQGDEPDCPFCGAPRVTRSSYIRCNPCGVNWGEETDIFRNPHMKAIASETLVDAGGVQTANAI